jgi:hypothetical protein
MYVHLTNVAIQKHGEAYNEKHGNKLPLENLKTYIAGIHGSGVCRRLWSEIENVVISSLKACQNVMINDRHCFELYGTLATPPTLLHSPLTTFHIAVVPAFTPPLMRWCCRV